MSTEQSHSQAMLGSYPDPLGPYAGHPALSSITQITPRNKKFFSYSTPANDLNQSNSNPTFPSPIVNTPNTASSIDSGYDTHIYFDPADTLSQTYAEHLHTAIRYQFPNLRVYSILYQAAGPHPTATFEVALFTLTEFATFVPWLALWRGPLSVLIHTNTFVADEDREARIQRLVDDHTVRALWLGEQVPLNLDFFANSPGQRGRKGEEKKRLAVRTEMATSGAGHNGIVSPHISASWSRRAMWER